MTNTTRFAIAVTLGLMAVSAIFLFQSPAPAPDGRLLQRAAFSDLAGWRDDAQSAGLTALRLSCARIGRRPDGHSLGADGVAGRAADWREICAALEAVTPNDDDAARRFLTTWFTPYRVLNRNGRTPQGLFTGYYEPALSGSRQRSHDGQVPLYARPDDLVTVELKSFRPHLAGQRIAGRIENGKLQPYPSRAEIVNGALAQRGKPLVWVDDPVAAFFLQIQGSGRVQLAGGGEMRLGYAAANGQPYTAIGRELVRRGALTRDAVSLQTIRAWLAAHPDQADDVMALNKSYVFFRELKGPGPIGAQGVALTPARSLAVDRRYIPLGAPVWLEAAAPPAAAGEADQRLRRLMVAQDTGSAIRGPVRGDVFWGYGDDAERIAGRMKHTGRYFLFLPKSLAVRIEEIGNKLDAD